MTEYQSGLNQATKAFITVAAMAGPLAIASIIFLLKKIEKETPEKIRWK